uniref:G-protein coupled receptors family 1 profile domain-containing protein n=1 Tax=Ciona savignyi TaxID=51511 RepID=H2YVS8_CIOSA
VSNKTINAFECDGKIECSDFSDECSRNCTNQPAFCGRLESFGPSKELLSCNSSNVINGSAGLARGSLTFTSAEVCNGKWLSCEPRINEEEQGCVGRFYCDNSTSIDSSRVCDGYHDCYNGQDETNCSTLFQCENRSNLSVPLNFLLDGRNDCPDGSDECPKFLDLKPDSSRFEMVKNPGVKIWIWVLGLFGIIGNGSVFVYTARRLLKEISTKGNVVSKSNKFLVLNLNLADGLMSIYFLFLAVKSAEFSGHYCLVDLQWRTGFPCTFMGSVALLAGEASLFTIVAMTSKRLYVVYYPIASRELRVRWLALAMFFVWAISITLAALPFALPSVFVEGYWMRTKLQSEPIVRTRHFNTFIRNVILISEPQNSSHLLQPGLNKVAYLSKYHPRFPILGEFGFYSENTLCVPHFFIPTNDNGWFYPTVIVAVNFLAFVFVSIAYYQIYRKATGTRVRSTASANKKSMQRRVTKLVVTNFATWLPIFVASFTPTLYFERIRSIFIATAVVLFPINSLSNPLLFSDLFEKI